MEFKTVHEHFQPRDTAHTEGGTERMNPSTDACGMIQVWDLKHLWKHVCMAKERVYSRLGCNVNVSTTSLSALTILGFVHINLIIKLLIF